MIARKIIYQGSFNSQNVGEIYNIARKVEMTGQIKLKSAHEVELILEGDPSMIKLIQHQVERKIKSAITGKTVEPHPYQFFQELVYLF
jgi:hypothetical protein